MKRQYVLPLVMVIVGLLVVLGFAVVPQTNAVTYNASVNVNTTYQTLEGFGASIAWYQSYLTAHPNREEVIDLLLRTWVSIFTVSGISIIGTKVFRGYRDHPHGGSLIGASH